MIAMDTPRSQRGATLVVGLIMLVLITLMVTSAFMLSSINLKAVGNMQFRDEAVAAANVAIERVVSSDFTQAPAASSHDVTLGGVTYTVDVSAPECIRSVPLSSLPNTDPDAERCAVGSGVATLCYETFWDIEANVRPSGAAAASGVDISARQGISKRVNVLEFSKLAACK